LPLVRVLEKSNSSTFKDLQTQIQGLSRTMSVFKDFPGLEHLEKLFQDFQGPARAPREDIRWDCFGLYGKFWAVPCHE